MDGVHLTGPQASNDFGIPRRGDGSLMDRLFTELNLPREYGFETLPPGLKPVRFAQDNYTNMDGFGESLVDVGYWYDGKIVSNVWSDALARTPYSPKVRRDLLAWRSNQGGTNGLTAQQLDGMSYRHFLEVVKGYDPEVTRFASGTIGLLTGLSPDAVAANACLRFVSDTPEQIPSFPGGNSGLVRPLVKKIFPEAIAGKQQFADMITGRVNFAAFDRSGQPVRLRLGSTAVRVGHDASGKAVRIVYSRHGRLHHVRASAVVMASGGWVNRRVLADMPEEIAAAYAQFVHAPALVVNVALSNWRPLYKLGVSALRWREQDGMLGFAGNIREPMIVPGATMPLHPDKPALFTLYMGLTTPGEA
ncbi:MAG TPA: hypothetical protein VIK18_06350, partial [Pirellulales bacterium]